MIKKVHTRKLIAVFGVSGVGKSSLINAAVKRWSDDIIHIVASDLIRSAYQSKPTADEIRLSSKDKILSNQDLLLHEFRRWAPEYDDRVVIFDGHSVVNNGIELIEVPVDIVSALSPNEIVFVQDKPKAIRDRRILDRKRTRPLLDCDQIHSEQALALEVCENYSRDLAIPMQICRPYDKTEFEKLVRNHIDELPHNVPSN